MIKTMDKTICGSRVVDTKLVQSRDGFMYHINRIRTGVIDTVNLSYVTKSGVKTVSKKIPSLLGWIGQAVLEYAIPLV